MAKRTVFQVELSLELAAAFKATAKGQELSQAALARSLMRREVFRWEAANGAYDNEGNRLNKQAKRARPKK